MARLNSLKHFVARQARSVPLLRKLGRFAGFGRDAIAFQSSNQYWQERYQRGGNSGEGSYGPLARYKADFINGFCRDHRIASAVEFGCGDGNQAAMLEVPTYLGVDISAQCIEWARRHLVRTGWSFETLDAYLSAAHPPFELGLSLDVIYHLVEDEVYLTYLETLSASASRSLLIYTSNVDHIDPEVPHVRHRPILADMARLHPEWMFVATHRNPLAMNHDEQRAYGSFADFHQFERRGA